MITIFAHSVGIVLFTSVTTLRNNFSMLLEDLINFADLTILRVLLNTLGLLTLNWVGAHLLSWDSSFLLVRTFPLSLESLSSVGFGRIFYRKFVTVIRWNLFECRCDRYYGDRCHVEGWTQILRRSLACFSLQIAHRVFKARGVSTDSCGSHLVGWTLIRWRWATVVLNKFLAWGN